MRLAALLALMLVVVAPACASAAGEGSGVLRGVVTRGPITPVCTDSQPCYAPAVGVKIVFLRRGRTAGRITTGAGGRYRIRLPAGPYAVRVRSGLRSTPTRVFVRRGRTTRLDIAIDTGIR